MKALSIFGTADLNKLSADLQINVERFPGCPADS